MIATLAFFIIYGGLLLTLCWHDLRYGLLPDKFTCPLLWGGLLYYLCMSPANLQHAVWGAIAGYLAFALIYWLYRGIRGREGIGYGDVKFLAALGAWQGWRILPQLVLIATILACAAVTVLILCGKHRQALRNPLPFGPFLATAGLLCGWQTFLVSHFNLRLKIILQTNFTYQIQLGFQPVDMAFFVGEDGD